VGEVERRNGPAIPLLVVVISLVVAAGSVSVLLYVLFQKTTGPGQVVREYYADVLGGDCDSAYGLLSSRLQRRTQKDAFCEAVRVARVSGSVPGSISIVTVTGHGEPPATTAEVTIQEHGPQALAGPVVWRMVREGHDWRVASFPSTPRCEGRAPHPPCAPIG
jgi:hypothetical protein